MVGGSSPGNVQVGWEYGSEPVSHGEAQVVNEDVRFCVPHRL